MELNQILIGCFFVFGALLMFGMVKNKAAYVLKVVFRAAIGVFGIFVFNVVFSIAEIPVSVGINAYSIGAAGLLGLPALAACYMVAGMSKF